MRRLPKAVMKVGRGVYQYRGRYAVRTSWDGVRGGTIWRWELGRPDPHGPGIDLDGLESWRTLREAVAEIDRAAGV